MQQAKKHPRSRAVCSRKAEGWKAGIISNLCGSLRRLVISRCQKVKWWVEARQNVNSQCGVWGYFFTYFQKCLEVSCVSFPFFPCFSLTWKVIVVIHHGLNMPKLCPLPALGEMYKRDVQVGHKEDALLHITSWGAFAGGFSKLLSPKWRFPKCNRTIKSWVRP